MSIESKVSLKLGEITQLAVLDNIRYFWRATWIASCEESAEKGELFVISRKEIVHISLVIQHYYEFFAF